LTDSSGPDLPGFDTDDAAPRRLIAGAAGPERVAYHKDREEPHWYEPLHVRAAAVSRDAMAELVAAGADVLVAPTWLTHRRALLPTGETRRAAAWTEAALRIAREAAETGLEHRERMAEAAAAEAERARDGRDARGDVLPEVDRDVARAVAARAAEVAEVAASSGSSGSSGSSAAAARDVPRHPVLVAGVLPALDVAPEPGVGRLLPRDVAAERDARAQAGLLAESGADLILVEGNPGIAQARVALEAAVETGLPVWVAQVIAGEHAPVLPSGESAEAWAESMTHAGAAVLLLSPTQGVGLSEAFARLLAGGVSAAAVGALPAFGTGVEAGQVAVAARRWLEGGAWHLGIADGATPERIAAQRAALDAIDTAHLGERRAARARWEALIHDAARRAPGGRAAWLGPRRSDDVPLPVGFGWVVVPVEAAATLPHGEFRLVVCVGGEPSRAAAALEPGGILLALVADPAALTSTGLRILERHTAGSRIAILARRDP